MSSPASPASQRAPGGEVVVIFGGRSEIGLAIARRLADGCTVVLATRPGRDVSALAAPLTAAGASSVEIIDFDADDLGSHVRVVEDIESRIGEISVAVLAFGILGDQEVAERDAATAARILHTDFVAQAALLTVLAERMKPRRRGVLVAFSSVAGQRVRRANYVYGSAKAGLDGFASGMADALHGTGVTLVIPRPGFVIGRMTEGMDPAPFSSTPDQVADAVVDRVRARRAGVVWIPWQLRVMFAVARLVPQPIWRRMPR
ncbi:MULTISPECIES: SDR family NAD(P)-dependent oxidoreductase [unclassified Dietzia]|uniref:SDR family NAD(P)-dependent oxidoreductase n=1 Tax=unclassified Dietzia TaxID=2617939 RepID=UPI000D1FFB00|nr:MULTISPECIES: SDR family NAD(P)-dependent oxidoreductase [unclassified Dietzia]AVZ39395.1 oxidoreductase [Dietzia sp. JS16-p6b]MBB1024828.1 SDR family NAD(P)-dependent oxidoreductase [Dietzia sp. DQ12-76]MBB1026965.1 SDR family NAD(P)-dependent oxidoreductase [Dietzia sp. DQ11-38-2]QGW24660.1 short chain dehydrogenase [Dietzia sp. DQ12-45-1b]